MDVIKLKNNATYEVKAGSSLGRIVIPAVSEAAALAVVQALTPANVESVSFLHDDAVIASYEGLTLDGDVFRVIVESGVEVRFGLRAKTETELAIEQLQTEQEIQNEAIDFLVMGGI